MQLSFVEVKIVATKRQKSERPYDTKNDIKNYVAASLQLLRMTQAPCVHVLMDGIKKELALFPYKMVRMERTYFLLPISAHSYD